MAESELDWPSMQYMECAICQNERERRNRVMAEDDPRVRRGPYMSAPYIHKHNEPKCLAMLLRAHEQANTLRRHILWFAAEDTPESQSHIVKTPGKL